MISVIVPVYNVESYIDQCLDSIVNQTYSDIEILIMEGKSTDGSLEKCKKWSEIDSRVKLVSRRDGGLGPARNYAINMAIGEFVTFIDADDWVSNDYIESLLSIANQHSEVDLVFSDEIHFSDHYTREKGGLNYENGIYDSTDDKNYIITYGNNSMWGKLIRKSLFIEHHIEQPSLPFEDLAVYPALVSCSKKIGICRDAVYYYYEGRVGSLFSNTKGLEKWNEVKEYGMTLLKNNNVPASIYSISETMYNSRLQQTFEKSHSKYVVEEEKKAHTKSSFINGKKYNTVAVWGIGKYYLDNWFNLYDPKISISFFIDSNESLRGNYPLNNGIVCIKPEEMHAYGIDFLIITPVNPIVRNKMAMLAQEKSIDYAFFNEVVAERVDSARMIKREISRDLARRFFEGKNGHSRLLLINTPEECSTIGDHAISTAERFFLQKHFPDKQVIEIGDRFFWNNRDAIAEYINDSDVLLIQGGGYLGTLWRHLREDTVRYIIQRFTNNRIIILPQTMFFEKSKNGNVQYAISKELMNSHNNLSVFLRERKSYEIALDLLDNKNRVFLVPDLVLSMNGLELRDKYYEKKRKSSKIAFCFKNDKETVCSKKEQQELTDSLIAKGYEVVKTTMFFDESIKSPEEREKVIAKKLNELSEYRLLITDAMHGMVLAAIIGTPCIGVDSITGKVGAIYDWIKDATHVNFASEISDVLPLIEVTIAAEIDNNIYNRIERQFDTLIDKIRFSI